MQAKKDGRVGIGIDHKKTRAGARVFLVHRCVSGIDAYSAANAALKVLLGRMALLALATSGR